MMGMYTELVLNVRLREDVDPLTLEALRVLYNGDHYTPLPAINHKFFKAPRARAVMNCCSYYFTPEVLKKFWFDDIAKCWFLSTRFDLKNYDEEIELFVDWLTPFIDANEGDLLGYKRYEEDDLPTLLIHPNNWKAVA